MNFLEHNFLRELMELQEKHGFFIALEPKFYEEYRTLSVLRIEKDSYLTCGIMGYNQFRFYSTEFSVREKAVSNNNVQPENSNNG